MALSDIGKHCIWADRQIVKMLSTISKEEFDKVPENTGRSLRDLIVHILAGYDMVLGNDYVKSMETNTKKNQIELLETWNNLVEKFIIEIESNPSNNFTVTMDNGSKREIKGQNYLLAYTDHSTYHRGQIVTTFKIVTGKEAVTTDYYSYLTVMNPI